ncbi:MAG: hypothetical protein ACLT2D_05250 [Oscillospiraceae bacterium]
MPGGGAAGGRGRAEGKTGAQDADRKVAMLVLATAAMACMILGVCVMRASAWIGAGLLGAAALLVRRIHAS